MNIDWTTIIATILSILGSCVLGSTVWIIKMISSLRIDIEVIKIQLAEALSYKDEIKSTKECIIRLDERQNKCVKDINAFYSKIRKKEGEA